MRTIIYALFYKTLIVALETVVIFSLNFVYKILAPLENANVTYVALLGVEPIILASRVFELKLENTIDAASNVVNGVGE